MKEFFVVLIAAIFLVAITAPLADARGRRGWYHHHYKRYSHHSNHRNNLVPGLLAGALLGSTLTFIFTPRYCPEPAYQRCYYPSKKRCWGIVEREIIYEDGRVVKEFIKEGWKRCN